MNSYSAIQEAIQHEILRQTDILDEGLSIDQETRGRNDTGKISYVMRSKEDAMDYRFMPEQDLPQLDLDLHWIDMLRTKLKPLPAESIGHYRDAY